MPADFSSLSRPSRPGVVAVASKIFKEKQWWATEREHNWSSKEEVPFRKWVVHYKPPAERNPHARQVYALGPGPDKRDCDTVRSPRRIQRPGRGVRAPLS